MADHHSGILSFMPCLKTLDRVHKTLRGFEIELEYRIETK